MCSQIERDRVDVPFLDLFPKFKTNEIKWFFIGAFNKRFKSLILRHPAIKRVARDFRELTSVGNDAVRFDVLRNEAHLTLRQNGRIKRAVVLDYDLVGFGCFRCRVPHFRHRRFFRNVG